MAMTVKNLSLLFCLSVVAYVAIVESASTRRLKRAAYQLPDGVEFYVGEIRTTFTCPGNGYYADVDNACQLFHVCLTSTKPDGSPEQQQYTFACGNRTVFNQFSMTCDHEEDAIPCEQASQFHYLNDLIGQGPNVLLHQDQDIERAAQYGSRTLTARANQLAADRSFAGGSSSVARSGPLSPATLPPVTTVTAVRSNGSTGRRQRPRTRPIPAAATQPSSEVLEVAAAV